MVAGKVGNGWNDKAAHRAHPPPYHKHPTYMHPNHPTMENAEWWSQRIWSGITIKIDKSLEWNTNY